MEIPRIRRDVEFPTVDGILLRGWFYSALANNDGGGKHPCIIMASGLAGLKEQFLPSYAQQFQAAGYGVLLYDHRNWGASDGLPRNDSNPIQQARDYSDAFDMAVSLEEVDAAKVVYWGSSMSGGAVLHAAAFDKRIRAVISQVPFVSGEALAPRLAPILNVLYAGRQQLKCGDPPSLMKLFPESSELAVQGDRSAFLNDSNLYGFLKALEDQNVPWSPNVTPQTLLNMLAFEPLAFMHRIAPTPLLLVAADSDHSSPTLTQLKAFALAYEPKKLVVLQHAGHFDPYYGGSFEQNIQAQLQFLRQSLT